jgi:exodeoxyribonuclease V gamma subunit
MDVYLPESRDETSDAIPVELNPLEKWSLGDKLLDARLGGSDETAWTLAERARGTLPPGALATKEIKTVGGNVDAVLAAASEHIALDAPRVPLTVRVPLPGGQRVVVGTVPDIVADTVVQLKYSKLAPKHRLPAWVRLLAATAMDPERPFSALSVGRCRGSRAKDVSISFLGPLGDTAEQRGATAVRLLADLVDLYDRGMREPLPLYCKTSGAWAEATWFERDAEGAARKEWFTSFEIPNEDRDPYHQLVLGGVGAFEDLIEPRFCSLARELWDPLLGCEKVEDC